MHTTYGTWIFRKADDRSVQLTLLAERKRWGLRLKTVIQALSGSRVEATALFKTQPALVLALRDKFAELTAGGQWEIVTGSGLATAIDLSPNGCGVGVEVERWDFTILDDDGKPEAVAVAIRESGSGMAPFLATVTGSGRFDHIRFADSLEIAKQWYTGWVRHLRRVTEFQAGAQVA